MKELFAVLTAIVMILLISFLYSWPVYMLWNGCLVSAIDSVKEVTWLQAWGLTVLTTFLFKTTINK